jgi:hypothetical protein
MDIPSQFAEWNLLGIIQFVILPGLAGITSYVIVLRGKLGRLRIQRVLVQDELTGRPVWKIIATGLGRPLNHCTIRVAGKILQWDGLGGIELDIGSDGIGLARVPFQIDKDSRVIVKSGSFLIFRSRFGHVEEVCMSN